MPSKSIEELSSESSAESILLAGLPFNDVARGDGVLSWLPLVAALVFCSRMLSNARWTEGLGLVGQHQYV